MAKTSINKIANLVTVEHKGKTYQVTLAELRQGKTSLPKKLEKEILQKIDLRPMRKTK